MNEDDRRNSDVRPDLNKALSNVDIDDIRRMFNSGGIGFAPKFQWPKMNPTPYVKFSDPKGKDAIEAGLKWRF